MVYSLPPLCNLWHKKNICRKICRCFPLVSISFSYAQLPAHPWNFQRCLRGVFQKNNPTTAILANGTNPPPISWKRVWRFISMLATNTRTARAIPAAAATYNPKCRKRATGANSSSSKNNCQISLPFSPFLFICRNMFLQWICQQRHDTKKKQAVYHLPQWKKNALTVSCNYHNHN